MLALRFFSILVGDFLAGYYIRKEGVDPHQFSHPVGFFRGAGVLALGAVPSMCCASLSSWLTQLCLWIDPGKACSCTA